MSVTDDLNFAQSSLNKRLVTQSEEDALRLLGVNVETIDSTRLVGTYTSRIAKNEEEFHSKAYRRSKKSCSYIVQFCMSSQNEYHYGEIQEFASIKNVHVAFVKRFPSVVTNICQNVIAAPNDENVQDLVTSMVLGAHHVPVADNNDSVLEAVLCENILAKCIVVKANEAFVHFYMTPVIDVNCT